MAFSFKNASETPAFEKLAIFRKSAFRKTNPLTKHILRKKTRGFLRRPLEGAGGVNVGRSVDALLPITDRACWKVICDMGDMWYGWYVVRTGSWWEVWRHPWNTWRQVASPPSPSPVVAQSRSVTDDLKSHPFPVCQTIGSDVSKYNGCTCCVRV